MYFASLRVLLFSIVAFAMTMSLAASAHAEPLRILLAVSHSRGAEGEIPLRHSGEDAKAVRDVFVSLGGFKDPILLTDPTPGELGAGFERARAMAQSHRADEVTFIFYFSGHGDRDRIHLGAEPVAMSDVASKVRAVPAGLRVLVTDACRNFPGRNKGISSAPGFEIAHDEKNAASGVVWFFAAGEGEAAQESDELDGALFTHFWVSGLRGAADANGDGNVTLAESYDFAYSQTLYRSARATGVLQRPEAVLDVREVSPMILTRTFGVGATLKFPAIANAHYLVYSQGSRAIAGEIWGAQDHAATLIVPGGRYVVQRRGAGGAGAIEIALAQGQARDFHTADFRAFQEEELAQKGGSIIFHPNEISAEIGVGPSRVMNIGETAELRYARLIDAWAFSLSLGAGSGVQSGAAENVQITSMFGDAMIERRVRIGRPSLSFGLGFEGAYFWQNLTRSDASRVSAAGYPTTESHSAFAPGAGGAVSFQVPLGATLFANASAHASLLFVDLEGASGPLWSVRTGLGIGARF